MNRYIVTSIFFILGILCSQISFTKDSNIEYICIYNLMNHKAWIQFKNHVNDCEICSDLGYTKFKMCNQSYYLGEAARPYITLDQLRLLAQGKIEFVGEE